MSAQAPPDTVLRLPSPTKGPQNWLARFFSHTNLARISRQPERTYPWYIVLWLTGVDYFSTLGYQPGIALLAAGALAVPATGILIVVTLLGAVPIYAAVAKRSYAGQGSIALLENLFSGWTSKIIVLVLLGFAGGSRRSDLVALNLTDIEFCDDGARATLRRSKTDQKGAGHVVGIPCRSNPQLCPVRTLTRWLDAACIADGPLLRGVDRHGNVAWSALTDRVAAKVLKRYCEAAGLDTARFSGHSAGWDSYGYSTP